MNTNLIVLYVSINTDNEIVGFADGGSFEETPPYDSEIGGIFVLKEYQRRGIGIQLVQHLLKYFQSQKWLIMVVSTLKENLYRKFYEKLGGIP